MTLSGRLVRRWLVCATAAVALAGCGPAAGPEVETPIGGAPVGESIEQLRQQAREALARYDTAVAGAGDSPRFVPVGELTGQLGDWEPAHEDNKLKLLSGQVVAAGPLPDTPRPTGEVRWVSGETKQVPLLSATATLDRLRAAGAGECPGCVPMKVTAARATTVRIETSRGPATVPAWEYDLEETAVRLTRVAVADSATVTVTPPSWDPHHAPGGLGIQSATITRPGTRLTVAFTGSPGPASQPCGVDYTGEAVESANAVVVIVVEHRNRDDQVCPAIGAGRTATLDLARPLGERAVLEVQQGMPVPVTITG
ncbi:hypothetical protein [Micromonospora sp. WMMD812]|uniref:hypothetical protein n=1 Tax=Micromonospora sp. WMMD812 TaxID=3015152 RepID=UPI00248BAFAB|nr:hypothetical protein [Micromonospora sp. WMMD812]WBB70795.1 hypothetical protein O7603_16155 [Micromonospora sp. WMMD812]